MVMRVLGGVLLLALSPLYGASSLRDAASARGIFIGAALGAGHLASDEPYSKVAAAQYSIVTAENACKWGPTEPHQGQFDFAGCDAVFNFTRQHKQAFRGHSKLCV